MSRIPPASPRGRRPLRVVMAALELVPLVKVGGLADMVASLGRVLARRGYDVTVILPAYQNLFTHRALTALRRSGFGFPFGEGAHRQRFHRYQGEDEGIRVLLLDDPRFSTRGGIYVDPETRSDYPDNADRYALFSRGVLEVLQHADLAPDILHVHDYQTALVPTLLRRGAVGNGFFDRTACVLTIHNMGAGHQGVYGPEVLDHVGLGRKDFQPGGDLEFWGDVNFLKAGILDADLITTVSPRYAEEIRSGPEFGQGLEGVLETRAGDLTGILNGIDTELWNPAADPHLEAPYDALNLEGKAVNKRALQERTGLAPEPDRPLVGVISRLVEQKGFDLVRQAAGGLLETDVSLVILGSGQPEYEEFFRFLASAEPLRVHYEGGFDDPLAHAIEAGADIFLMPSRYEPCGLNQMMSLRYGTVPVVHRVGGLADTVRSVEEDPETGTGFVFDEFQPDAMLAALERAVAAYRDRSAWRRIMRRGMAEDFSWERSGGEYEAVYRRALNGRGTESKEKLRMLDSKGHKVAAKRAPRGRRA